jgi:hypothetical protein
VRRRLRPISDVRTSDGGVWVRLLASLGALALGAAAVAIVAVLAHRTPGPAAATNAATASSGEPATTTRTSEPSFPAPPKDAVVFSRPAGNNVLALGVVPGKRLLLQASVLGIQGQGLEGLDVSFGVGGKTLTGKPCGAGCYRTKTASSKVPKAIEVHVAGKKPVTWRVPMPRPWPPHDGSAIVARAAQTIRKLQTLTIDDALSSGLGRTLHTRWVVAAPNRVTYQVKNGPAAVIIGKERWDKVAAGEPWVKSAQSPLRQPVPFWVSWKNANVIGSTPKTWTVTFFDPKTPGWYEIRVAKDTRRTLGMRMHAAAHFMEQTYSNFNAPVQIVPPR